MARPAEKIIFANGVFDLLHEGHIALLRFAASLGDHLVVGLNSDASVKALKGPSRPIQDEQTRKVALERLAFVDEVIIFSEKRTTALVAKVRPHIIVKGAEYAVETVRRDDAVPEEIDIVLAPILIGGDGEKISTTALIKKME